MVKRTLAALAVLVSVAACGSSGPAGTTPTPRPPTSTGPVATPPHDFAMARTVTLVRSGGIQGGRDTVVFAAERPPPRGFTAVDVAQILKAAANPLLKRQPVTPPGSTCCDRYVYRVTITWPAGPSSTYTTVDGAAQTPAFASFLRLLT